MENWVLLRKGADYQSISQKYHISPRLAVLIRNRDIIGDEAIREFLYGSISDLQDGMLMKDMDKGTAILMEKIREEKQIRIIGDYDIDGVCAAFVLLEGLKKLGANVDSDIPDRLKDGYGLNRQLIERALEAGVDTILTCDNGIAAVDEIAYAKEMGMTVIVTDHHEIPYEEIDGEKEYLIPDADALIDPKQQDCLYPFKGLCGTGVAYKLVEALFESMGKDASDIDDLIEVVAIATVGDVMDLNGENRLLVKQGLAMLRRTKNLGLKALIECTGIDPEKLSAYHVGFVLGPCLNAGGRLDTARRALDLLCAKNREEADVLAGDLKALNESRKEMTLKAVKEAVRQIEETELKDDKVLVVFLPDCHESLAGIVAGRIRERYYKPAFILTKAEEGAKGSGRSIDTYHMYEELNKCSHLLRRFGGHKLAAGLSLDLERVAEFRSCINHMNQHSEEEFQRRITIDMKLPLADISESFVQELKILEPFGKGNTKPVFAESGFSVISGRILGKNQNVLKLQVADKAGTRIEALYFGEIEEFLEYIIKKGGSASREEILAGKGKNIPLDLTYFPDVNSYMGKNSLQIIIQNYR